MDVIQIIRNKKLSGRFKKDFFFILLLVVLSVVYNYPEILFKRPQSVHNWRQSDCASIALNYYQHGMKFFKPEVHALISNNFTTGYAATSEVPLMYYGVAMLYKVFGPHDYVYRMLITLIFLFGIYSLFRLLDKLKIDVFWSYSFSLLFFASPVLVYYGNNFLTDIAALSFALAGWNHFVSYYQKGKEKHFIIAMLFFLLGMSMKISAGISVVTILAIFILETLRIKFKSTGKLFPHKAIQILPFIVVFVIVGGWAVYARYYNTKNSCGYFSTQIFPLWDTSLKTPAEVIHKIRFLWLDHYYHRYTLVLFLVLFVVNLLHIKKANKLFMLSGLIMFAGVICYVLLWFQTFADHDYYTINLYILLIMIVVIFAEYINRLYPDFARNTITRGILVFIVLFNVYHTRLIMDQRYNDWWNEHPKFSDFDSITPYLRSIGITRDDKVISLPDQSHHTLYLMNQPGWTECYGLNKDSISIQQSINRGARYLMVASAEDLKTRPFLKSFINNPLGKYRQVLIYKLP